MKNLFPILLALTACSAPQVTAQREMEVGGNKLLVTSTKAGEGRGLRIENLEKRWVGKYAGGQEKWSARVALLDNLSKSEIISVCGGWAHNVIKPATYNMMDKDETMGGVAPVLGVTALMVGHLVASSNTDPANVPVGVYTEFRCPKDEVHGG